MDYRYPLFNNQNIYGDMYSKQSCGKKLAEAYVPYQQYRTSFPPMEALEMGTMFPELVRPYEKESRG